MPDLASFDSPSPYLPASVSKGRRSLIERLFPQCKQRSARSPAIPESRKGKLYDDIGRFLFAHDLDLTPLNFGCAHDYIEGGDPELASDMQQAVLGQNVSDTWIEDYVATRQKHAFAPDMLIEIAGQVESELDRCLTLVGRSVGQASAYSASLSATCEGATPEEMIAHLAELTREMIGQTRLAEIEMRASYSQVSQLRCTLRTARRASEIDHLTGLPNRRGFERRVAELCGQEDGPLAIVLCDVDHFKAVNDRFGHETGDRVLKLIARELRTLKRGRCSVARLGGEEFAVLLSGHTVERAGAVVNRVREKMSERNLVDSVTQTPIGQVSFSAGVAIIENQAMLKQAMRLADAALYAAKHAGRNRIYAACSAGQLAPLHD